MSCDFIWRQTEMAGLRSEVAALQEDTAGGGGGKGAKSAGRKPSRSAA